MYESRLALVHQMHEYIMNIGDEKILEVWFDSGLPDNPCEEDFEFFAKYPNAFQQLCRIFGFLIHFDKKENY